MRFFVIFALHSIAFNTSCHAVELRSIQTAMYTTASFEFCMRYVTRNGTTGCSSAKSGNRGQLIDVSSLNELKSSAFSFPIVALVPAQKDVLDYAIHHAPWIVGILIDGQTDKNHFTEVQTCPEHMIGLTAQTNCSIRKNPSGIDFRGIRIDKPIFLLTNATAVAILRNFSQIYNHRQLFKSQRIDAQ